MRFGVWDPHENPGRRPKDRANALGCGIRMKTPGAVPKTGLFRALARLTVFRLPTTLSPTTSDTQKESSSQDSAQGCFYCVFPRRDRLSMLPLRSYVHLNNAELVTCGILALFFGQLVSFALCTTALASCNAPHAAGDCGTFGEAFVCLNLFPL